MKVEIKICKNNHCFLEGTHCPYCGESFVKIIEARPGDCIHCGNLCADNAYGCTEPKPMDIKD